MARRPELLLFLLLLPPRAALGQEPHWAFRPLARPAVPELGPERAALGPIDRFVQAELDAAGLEPVERATPRELASRVALDLTGLPPTPDELRAFEADPSAKAYEALVERALGSAAHAEHYALAWLDAARYADSNGYQNDGDRYAWPWRDWIVEALHANRPLDQLVVEMIAGDLLPEASEAQRLATAFLRMNPLNNEGGAIPEEVRFGYVVDRVNTVATSFLGLTVACAQCHDHKLDPVSQREYYELFAFFDNLDDDGTVDANRRNSYHQYQLEKPWLELPQWKELCGGEAPLVMIAGDRATPRETKLRERGAYDKSVGEPLAPAVPRALGALPADAPRNRLGLARWIASRENPLFARVQANRAWQQLFGRGLVGTPEDFGLAGERPTHPALLEWLACELVASGFDQRALLRALLASETYQRSARASATHAERDPQNRLYARSSRHRLSSFALRDRALALAGLLDPRVGGLPVYPYHPAGLWKDVSFEVFDYPATTREQNRRRTLYSFWRRTVMPPALFDAAHRQSCVVRPLRTSTPLHSLVLWNDPTYVEAARVLAARVVAAAATDEERLATLFERATLRAPRELEAQRLRAALHRERARYAADPAAASALLAVGFEPPPTELAPVELAAWSALALLAMNLDEGLCRP
ncbi:MAG: DUF1549 domain-containing protein [Planctomycetes bacterium]|nr:DUF1549 domain-containing protein [Planctomycetota bacterium]